MNTYSLVLFLHFVGMVALFIGYGLEWTASTLLRGAAIAGEARAWLRVYRGSLPVSGPGLLVLILTGFYMAGVNRMSKEGWVMASLLGIAVALVIGFGVLLPRMKALRAALPEGNAALTGAALSRAQDPVITTLIRARVVLALGIVYVMTFKPELATSLIILVVAMVLGALWAASSWSRGSAKG